MNTSTRILILTAVVAAVAAAVVFWQKRDKYPDENDAFEGSTPPPGDGMSMEANASARS